MFFVKENNYKPKRNQQDRIKKDPRKFISLETAKIRIKNRTAVYNDKLSIYMIVTPRWQTCITPIRLIPKVEKVEGRQELAVRFPNRRYKNSPGRRELFLNGRIESVVVKKRGDSIRMRHFATTRVPFSRIAAAKTAEKRTLVLNSSPADVIANHLNQRARRGFVFLDEDDVFRTAGEIVISQLFPLRRITGWC